jgi:hypothetical protein
VIVSTTTVILSRFEGLTDSRMERTKRHVTGVGGRTGLGAHMGGLRDTPPATWLQSPRRNHRDINGFRTSGLTTTDA